MKPSKPFLFCLALVTACGATVFLNAPSAHAATAEGGMPLSTKLTPAMIDFFGLQVAYEHPTLSGLVACQANPACGQSDSSRVRFFDSTGVEQRVWDGAPGSEIEQVRDVRGADVNGVTESRHQVRRYGTDVQGRLVMHGTDTIVRVATASATREASRITHVQRYSDVRYLVTDPRFIWPLTGLVVLELKVERGDPSRTGASVPTASHAAVSFDGTATAHIITTGALIHTADLQARRLDTSIPDR